MSTDSSPDSSPDGSSNDETTPTLNEALQLVLADIIHDMVEDEEAADSDHDAIALALSEGADRLLVELLELLQEFQPSFEQSLRVSPADRRAEWRTEMHAALLAHAPHTPHPALVVDTLAMRGMAKAEAESLVMRAELGQLREHNEHLEDLIHSITTKGAAWFTEGADFSRCPGNAIPTLAQIWGELLSMDPDDRLEELSKLMNGDTEGRVLR